MPTSTTRYAFQKPIVGGDADVWGGSAGLNGNLDEMDALFAAIATTGTPNAYVLTSGLSLPAYSTGQVFRIIPNFTNTGAATINVDGLGARNLTKQGATALVSGDLTSGRVYTIAYDGTQWQVLEYAALGTAQPLDATLTALAGLSTGADQYIRATGVDTFAMSTITASWQTALTDATAVRLGSANVFTQQQAIRDSIQSAILFRSAAGTGGFGVGRSVGGGDAHDWFVYDYVALAQRLTLDAAGLFTVAQNMNVSGTLRGRVRGLTTTTGTLVVSDANCAGTLTGGITLPNSVFTAGDMIFVNAGAANRTITRGAGIAMHLNGTDVASATLNANTGGGIFWETASKAILTGAFV